MKITASAIEFETFNDLKSFMFRNNLFGIIKLIDAITDNNGKVLVKENVTLKETTIAKLEELVGSFSETFKVQLSKDILKKFREAVAEKIIIRLKESENSFLKHIYKDSKHNYEGYIANALQNKKLLLAIFKISSERENFFNYISELGLISLGIMIQKFYRVRMIHRYSFLAGLCADLQFADGNEWKTPAGTESERSKRAQDGASFLQQFDLPDEIVDAVAKHSYSEATPDVNRTVKIKLEEIPADGASVFDDIIGAGGDDEDEPAESQYDDNLAGTLIEAMRIARYINDVHLANEEKDFLAEELVYYLAYNAEKGRFYNDLVNPVIDRFRDFEKLVRKARKVAEIEGMCLKKPSAWAYPKPNATQVLCKNRVYDCPKIVSGWDIHIIAEKDISCWVGTTLTPGDYAKCSLETLLETVNEEIEEEYKEKNNPK